MNYTTKSVTFSPMSQMILIPYPTQEMNRKKWISAQEHDQYKHSFRRDVCKSSDMLASKAILRESLTEDDMIKCLGLESVISPAIAERVMQIKKMHLAQVLEEQSHQRDYHATDILKLAQVSLKSSYESRERSQKIAARMMALGESY